MQRVYLVQDYIRQDTENNQALNGRPNDLTPWELTLIQKP